MNQIQLKVKILDWNRNDNEKKLYIRYYVSFNNGVYTNHKEKVCDIDENIHDIVDYLHFTLAEINMMYQEAKPSLEQHKTEKHFSLCIDCDGKLEQFREEKE